MSTKTIITIARQYGSGGREIGEKVAKRLGIPFYNKDLITLAAKQSGMSPEFFEKADEKATNSLLYSLMMGNYTFGSQITPMDNLPINDKLFLAQSQIIREAAEKGPCVIVGRCADYVLRENKNCLHVFIYADHFARMDRIIKKYDVDPAKAADTLVKQDKQRANYYNFYSNQKWGSPENYHLMLESSAFGIENSIDLICKAVEMKENAR